MYKISEYPLVSIIIPAYNQAAFLTESIESVLAQSYKNIELIVIDDGSTDSTINILESYGDKFYWENHENIGQARTLNKGWGLAKGEILSYLSADDILEKNAVCTEVEFLKNNESIVMTYSDFNIIDATSNIIKVSRRPDYSYYDLVVNLNCIPGPGVFFKKTAFERAGLWNSNFRQIPDYEYWLRLGITGEFIRIPKVLANFRIHKESQTFSLPSEDKAEEPIDAIKSYFKREDVPLEIKKYKTKALSNAYIFSTQLHVKAGRYMQAFNRLCEAIKIYPKNIVNLNTYKKLMHGIFSRPAYLLTMPNVKLIKSMH